LQFEALRKGELAMDLQLNGKRALITGSTVGIALSQKLELKRVFRSS